MVGVAVDLAAGYLADLSYPRQIVVMLGTLCHDLGKPPTTRVIDPKLESHYLNEGAQRPLRRVMSNSFGFGGSNCSLIFGRG